MVAVAGKRCVLLNVRYVSITTKFRTAADTGNEGDKPRHSEWRISRGVNELMNCVGDLSYLIRFGHKAAAFGQVVRRDLRVT